MTLVRGVCFGKQCVFLWNASTGATQKLLETSGAGNIVTSLAWGDDPTCNTLAGTSHGPPPRW